MRVRALLTTVVLMLTVIVTPAIAQTRSSERRSTPVPAPDQIAVGVATGFAMPSASDLETGMGLTAQIERYLTSRASLRGQLSGAWTDVFAQPFEGSVKPMRIAPTAGLGHAPSSDKRHEGASFAEVVGGDVVASGTGGCAMTSRLFCTSRALL